MRAILLGLLAWAVWAQPGGTGIGGGNPPVSVQCTATRTINCTPRVDGAGAIVPTSATAGNATTLASKPLCAGAVTTDCVRALDSLGNLPIDTTLSTDKATPDRHATKTTYYTKGGKVCALPSTADGGAETCTGATANQAIREIPFSFDGGGSALSGTITRCNTITYAGTITGVYVIADQTGDATMDVLTVAFASYTGPASAASITNGAPPALTADASYSDTTLTGWTKTLAANTVVCATLSSPATVTWVQGKIKVEVSQ